MMIDQLLSHFTFEIYEIVILVALFILLLVRLFFYISFYYKSYLSAKKKVEYTATSQQSSFPKVSVVIASENEAIELSKNLPLILTQDYPNYEVIVVNNGSTDESDDLLQSLKLTYPNLYFTYVPFAYDRKFSTRKLALTLGVKAATGDIVIFTEPYSKPTSNKWISSMMKEMTEDKEVVLGYSFYTKTKQFFNRIARFDNHLYSMQYLSMAVQNKPFTGTYRNVAYRKQLFFENKGFASYLHLDNGEDMFINKIVKKGNTAVALSQDSFIETNLGSFSLWKQIKKSYSLTRSQLKGTIATLLKLDVFSRYTFYLLAVGTLIYAILMSHWALLGITAFIIILKLILELVILNKPTKYFNSGKFYLSFLIMDIVQPIYNFRFRTRYKMKIK